MTLRLLTIFLEVARCRKMSLASEHLHITQPTVSQAIAELEEYYQVKLFERFPKTLYLTEAGEVLVSYAEKILAEFDRLSLSMEQIKKGFSLRMGIVTITCSDITDMIMESLHEQYPGIDLRFFINNTLAIQEQLALNTLDIALVKGSLLTNPNIVAIPVIPDYIVPFCSPQHALAHKEQVKLEDLFAEKFYLREKETGARLMLEEIAKRHNLRLTIKAECNSIDMIKDSVIHQQVMSYLSIRRIDSDIQAGRLCVVRSAECIRRSDFCVAYHKSKESSLPVKEITDVMQRYAQEHPLDSLLEQLHIG